MNHGKAWLAEKKVCWPTCKPCHDALVRYRKRVVYRRDSGTKQTRVPAEPTRKMIRVLVDEYRYSRQQISVNTDIPLNTVCHLYREDIDRAYVLSGTEAKVSRLYVNARRQHRDGHHDPNLVDARLARLAARGLMAQGWNQTWIAGQIGMTRDGISSIVRSRPSKQRKYVKQKHHDALVQLARKTGSAQGPDVRTRNYAARKHWKPTIYTTELV